MKNLKHYTFVFTNNDGVTITTMALSTPKKNRRLRTRRRSVNVTDTSTGYQCEYPGDCRYDRLTRRYPTMYKQITLEEYLEECTKENDTVEGDPCKDCTNRTCEWSTCSYSND